MSPPLGERPPAPLSKIVTGKEMRIPKSKRKLKKTELVEDGGFENNSADWVWGGDGVHDRSTDYPHTDDYSARTGWPDGGQTLDAHDYVYQEISIPDTASCVTFSFWWSIRSDDYCDYDFASVYIKDTNNNVLDTVLDFCCDGDVCTTLYEEVTYDLGSYAGETVRLWFETRNMSDAAYSTWTYYDDVSLCYAPLAVELAGFDVIGRDGNIELFWRTEAELNNVKWLIARSLSKELGYEQIATVPAKGPLSNYHYVDSTVQLNTTYYYKLGDVNKACVVTWHSPVKGIVYGTKYSFFLRQPTPNPFKNRVNICYGIPGWSWERLRQVRLKVYDLSGRVVRKLVNESQSPGRYTTHWDGKDEYGNQVSGGAYFCHLKVGTKLLIRSLICIK